MQLGSPEQNSVVERLVFLACHRYGFAEEEATELVLDLQRADGTVECRAALEEIHRRARPPSPSTAADPAGHAPADRKLLCLLREAQTRIDEERWRSGRGGRRLHSWLARLRRKLLGRKR